MANPITIRDAQKFYKRHTPTHGRSKTHKEDLEVIAKATSPMQKADTLIAKRRDEAVNSKITDMLVDHQGRKKRYIYNQEAVIGLEHLFDGPLDPTTQMPLWTEMLRKIAKGAKLSPDEFYSGARTMLDQVNLFDPETMTA